MEKSSLLKSIAIKGYDVGFGAKKHFATYDLACKAPNIIAIITLTAGVTQLGFELPILFNKVLSIILIFIGILAIFINYYGDDKKKEYVEAGVKINTIYQDLRNLYFSVQGSTNNEELQLHEKRYEDLIKQFNNTGISQQMMFSDWYAHYKFFVQLETDWIEEQKPFRWKDKIPLSFLFFLTLVFIGIATLVFVILV